MPEFLFSEEAISVRYADFFRIADNFCLEFGRSDRETIEIDASLLYMVVVAMYDDIARYKSYHLADPNVQKANAIKRAAYGMKWIMQFCPLIYSQAGHLSGTLEDHDGLANADFAIHFALVNLESLTGKEFDLSDNVYYGLLYDVIYRNLGADAFIFIFELICKSALEEEITLAQS